MENKTAIKRRWPIVAIVPVDPRCGVVVQPDFPVCAVRVDNHGDRPLQIIVRMASKAATRERYPMPTQPPHDLRYPDGKFMSREQYAERLDARNDE